MSTQQTPFGFSFGHTTWIFAGGRNTQIKTCRLWPEDVKVQLPNKKHQKAKASFLSLQIKFTQGLPPRCIFEAALKPVQTAKHWAKTTGWVCYPKCSIRFHDQRTRWSIGFGLFAPPIGTLGKTWAFLTRLSHWIQDPTASTSQPLVRNRVPTNRHTVCTWMAGLDHGGSMSVHGHGLKALVSIGNISSARSILGSLPHCSSDIWNDYWSNDHSEKDPYFHKVQAIDLKLFFALSFICYPFDQ